MAVRRGYSKRWCPRKRLYFDWWILYPHSRATAFTQTWAPAGGRPWEPEHSLSLKSRLKKVVEEITLSGHSLTTSFNSNTLFVSQPLFLSPWTSLHHLLLYLPPSTFPSLAFLSLNLPFTHHFHHIPHPCNCHWEQAHLSVTTFLARPHIGYCLRSLPLWFSKFEDVWYMMWVKNITIFIQIVTFCTSQWASRKKYFYPEPQPFPHTPFSSALPIGTINFSRHVLSCRNFRLQLLAPSPNRIT